MNKYYWITCEKRGQTVFEGKFQGPTRGSAIKFLKQQMNCTTLTGYVYSVSEVPEALIREIVKAELVRLGLARGNARARTSSRSAPAPEPAARFDAFDRANLHPVEDHQIEPVTTATPGLNSQ